MQSNPLEIQQSLIVDGSPRVEEKRVTNPALSVPSPTSTPVKPPPALTATPSPPAPRPATAPADSQPVDVRVTVVDIAKDGSYVLISNPKTRLPERFTVGQKIFTGETIQKIEPTTGRVQLDKRAVALQ